LFSSLPLAFPKQTLPSLLQVVSPVRVIGSGLGKKQEKREQKNAKKNATKNTQKATNKPKHKFRRFFSVSRIYIFRILVCACSPLKNQKEPASGTNETRILEATERLALTLIFRLHVAVVSFSPLNSRLLIFVLTSFTSYPVSPPLSIFPVPGLFSTFFFFFV
jgi:hypothetical protein